MKAMFRNPFQALNPISEPDMFFGPFAVLNRLLSAAASKQNVSLLGSRHSGKTTLLRCMMLSTLQNQFGFDFNHHIFIYFDVRNCLRRTCDGFLEFLCEEIITACRERVDISPSSKTGEDRFMNLLRQLKAQHFYPVLLLDAFDTITSSKAFDPQFFMFLRAQATAGLVSYVTASIKPLTEISHPAVQGSPFFNIFAVFRAMPLALDEARNLIMIPSLRAGCPFTDKERERIVSLTGGHPFFIQRACYLLFEQRCARQDDGNDHDSDLDNLEAALYEDLSSHFEYLWNDLNAAQKKEARRKDTSVWEKNFPELAASPLFRRYALAPRKLPASGELVENLKEALKHLDSPALLARSRFRQLKIVSARFEQTGATSAFEEGKAVREVFYEALEMLKGEGTRTDTDPAWLAYNILSYTYFHKRSYLTQQAIATKYLAISLRQYHREKDEAIIALCDCLLEMEIAFKEKQEEA
jgi:hypothetical protein